MILKCVADYSSELGTYRKGEKTDDLSDEQASLLMRDSPGSFEPVKPRKVKDVSEETASGMSVPDRRARGGRRRS